MKNNLLLFLITIINLNAYSQISFEKGYYIDNNNQKINCLIKNLDWKNNPYEFEYKLSENDESKKVVIDDVKEFGVDNVSKYIRSSVNIDRSSEVIFELSKDKRPIFKEELLFLEVLVQGNANLYFYRDGDLRRYFYNKESSDIEQLVYKSYLKSNKTGADKIGKNNAFRNQLWNNLKCPAFKAHIVNKLDYKKRQLINLFIQYNECTDPNYTNSEEKKKRDLFNLSIRPGLNSSSLFLRHNSSSIPDFDFSNKLTLRLGLETEFIFPFNKNKWSLVIEPTYQSFSSEKTSNFAANITGGYLTSRVKYSSIEIPFGLRHYFFISEDSKIFVNASYIIDINSKSSITLKRDDGSDLGNGLEINSNNNLAFGVGYKIYDRFSLEIRLYTSRDIIKDYVNRSSDYNTLSVIFGYSIF